MIRRLEHTSIRPLAAAQVIFDLASAVKELVDNSIDAGASQIKIQDNGHGVPPEDMHKVGQRSYTSKITSDLDLYTSQSRGFRGEALHCLAALSSELAMISRWKDNIDGLGTRIILSKDKEEATTVQVACNHGTTVYIKGLLSSLPVRLAEWRRNTKRYFSKTIYFLQSYLLAVPSIKIRCIHGTQTLFSSSGSGDVAKVFAEAFGGNELKGKLRRSIIETDHASCEIHFAPSKRKSPDRQFLFINGKPCELSKLFKRLNETIKSHGWNDYATIIVHVSSKELIDFNLVPDKRQVVIPFENELIEDLLSKFALELAYTTEVPRMLPSSINFTPTLPPKLISEPEKDADHNQQCESSQTSLIDCLPSAQSFIDVSLESQYQSQFVVEKTDFAKMEIIGQYNCGFILAGMTQADGVRHVFIIDQHASDERFRLESLEATLTFTVQSLVHPINLNLGIDDMILVEGKAKELRAHGFAVRIEDCLQVGQKLQLITSPHVAGVQLDHEDFIEMLALLKTDRFKGLHSLNRVAESLGYKACRSAIMIGDPLNLTQMTQVVRNLEKLSKPWVTYLFRIAFETFRSVLMVDLLLGFYIQQKLLIYERTTATIIVISSCLLQNGQ